MGNFELMLKRVVIKYFQIFSCIYVINDRLDMDLNAGTPMMIQNITNLGSNIDRFKCEGFVVISRNVTEYLIAIERHLRYINSSRYTNRRYLLVSRDPFDVGEYCSLHQLRFIMDVTVIIPKTDITDFDRCEIYEFWTHKYVSEDSQSPILLVTWFTNSTFSGVGLYPDKLKNQMWRELAISAVNYEPYVNIETWRGVELMMVSTFVDIYNFSATYITSNDTWGYITYNFTGFGSKYFTANGLTDLSVGGFYAILHRYSYLEISIATVRNGLGFLVPHAHLKRGLYTPLRPFTTESWLLLAILIITVIVSYHILLYLYTRVNLKAAVRGSPTIFLIYGMLLQQPFSIRVRVFGAFVLMFGVLFVAFYNSGLSSSMAKPIYENEIKTITDLELSHIPIKGASSSDIDKIQNDVRYKSIVKRFKYISTEHLVTYMQETKYFALTLEHLPTGYSLGYFEDVLDVHDIEAFRILKEDLSYENCVIFGYKHSVLMPALDEHILRVKESGLDKYWLTESFLAMSQNFRMYFKYEYKHSRDKLNWKSVEGIFAFWAIGLAIACLRFLYEIYEVYQRQGLLINKNVFK